MVKSHCKGLSNTTTYTALWGQIHSQLHQASHAFWGLDAKLVRNTLKARYGCLWSQKLAYRYGLAPDDRCPLCGEPDGASHYGRLPS